MLISDKHDNFGHARERIFVTKSVNLTVSIKVQWCLNDSETVFILVVKIIIGVILYINANNTHTYVIDKNTTNYCQKHILWTCVSCLNGKTPNKTILVLEISLKSWSTFKFWLWN